MSKTILIAGAGPNQIGIFTKARQMSINAVAADGNPQAEAFPLAAAAHAVNILDPGALVEIAKLHRVDGIYPAAELAVEAVAVAAERLGLPGVRPEGATRVRNKLRMREALDRAGLPNPAYRGVRTIDEAEAAAREIGLPLIVKPADANSSRGVLRIDRIEDLPRAVDNARVRSRSKTVLLEAYMDGPEFCVDGLVYRGQFRLGGITGKEVSPLPYRFDKGIYMPPLLGPAACASIETCTAGAVRAIGFDLGVIHAEIILTGDGPRVVEIAGRPGGGRIPTDLIPLAYGCDFIADSLRIFLGEPPRETKRHERGAALFWIDAGPGTVAEILRVDEARRMPGVVDVILHTRVGDTLAPIVDCVTRDRVGYVLAEGGGAEEALRRAKNAASHARIVTRERVET
jgi:biotin carboxylase